MEREKADLERAIQASDREINTINNEIRALEQKERMLHSQKLVEKSHNKGQPDYRRTLTSLVTEGHEVAQKINKLRSQLQSSKVLKGNLQSRLRTIQTTSRRTR